MSGHRLDPLLRPSSIAVVGASRRAGGVGHTLIRHLKHGGFEGALYAVNPKYDEVEGVPCHASLADLPAPVEHVVIAVPDECVEAAFDEAVCGGARAATIVSALALDGDSDPPLRGRIRAKADAAGVVLCGGNSNGLYNFEHKLWVCGFETRLDHRAGGVTLITHSGSVFNALVDCEARIDYNLAVSSGQELTVTLADYMDFALVQPTTRVIGLFMETARDPAGFRAALEKAAAKDIPVVALKVGASARGAAMAESHSGALAGDDGAYQALFDRYGVLRVDTIDELAVTLMMFAQPRPVAAGALATIHDSGGERALILDLAERAGVPFSDLQPATLSRLEATLDPGLAATNPLDAWGTGRDYWNDFTVCLTAMMQDPGTALGAVVADRGPDGKIFPEYPHFARSAAEASGKPVFVVSNHQGSGSSPDALAVTREGLPVLDGIGPFLEGVKHLLGHRDFRTRAAGPPPAAEDAVLAKWRNRLTQGAVGEADALAMLADFGVPAVACREAASLEDAQDVADALGYPVALKTAEPGIAHKSERGGVRLGLAGAAAVEAAYQNLAETIGPRVLVARMVEGPSVEMILGMTHDRDFGPVIVVGSGGIHAELLQDVVFALPPFDAVEARRLLDRLRLRPLLDGPRDAPPADVGAFCEAVANFSVLATGLGDWISSMDVNPVLAGPEGCFAVDAMIVPRTDHASRAA